MNLLSSYNNFTYGFVLVRTLLNNLQEKKKWYRSAEKNAVYNIRVKIK